jgi:hypothetical protein
LVAYREPLPHPILFRLSGCEAFGVADEVSMLLPKFPV